MIRRLFVRLIVAVVIGVSAAVPVDSAPAGGVVYATVYGAGVASFDAGTGRRLGLLRSGSAFGVAVDGAGNLYVGNDGSADPASFLVRVFAPGGTKPMRAIQTRQQLARFAVSAAGELALAGFGGGDCCANELEFFAPGQSTPYRHVVATRDLAAFEDVAFDANGDCWVDGFDAKGRPVVGYVTPGSFRVTFVPFAGLATAGPLAIDGAGDVVISGHRGLIQVFAPSGILIRRWTLMDRPDDLTAIAVSPDDRRLYVASEDTQLAAYEYDPAHTRPDFYFGSYANGLAVEP